MAMTIAAKEKESAVGVIVEDKCATLASSVSPLLIFVRGCFYVLALSMYHSNYKSC
jgi:hypothetical protein